MFLPGSEFSVDLQASWLGGHLTQVHLSRGLEVHSGRALDTERQGQTAGGGHGHLRVQELLPHTEPASA